MKNEETINFMPGPVNLHPEVKKVYHETFLSHRSAKFYEDFNSFTKQLCGFLNAQKVALFVGSGSLANEVVAQYLKQLQGKGLILINGEFSKRLKEQASQIELDFDCLEEELGNTFDTADIEKQLASKQYAWLWFVHCETSSGVLNPLEVIKDLGNKYNTKVAVDCISTIGNVLVNLDGIFLAAGTSGKGLASYPGIAMVYYDAAVLNMLTKGIPRYMNLKYHAETNGVPYTMSTNLFYALCEAFKGVNTPQHQKQIETLSDYLYEELSALGFSFLGNYSSMMPGIISIVCPPEINSYDLGVELERNNFYVNYGGSYLRKANYFQICIMGHQSKSNVQKLLTYLQTVKQRMSLQIV